MPTTTPKLIVQGDGIVAYYDAATQLLTFVDPDCDAELHRLVKVATHKDAVALACEILRGTPVDAADREIGEAAAYTERRMREAEGGSWAGAS